MSEHPRILAGAILGAVVGAAAAYLFYTERGRAFRVQIEPAVDNLSREFGRFRRTVERVGGMAYDGVRAFQEFQSARQPGYGSGETH